ncbi:Hypothetical protein SMAX5B_018689 [Scophthalmus maximus]|uniref:Uncharacterized protein n=1 Tax=Scophthalmus maximus TaxID=52904 RepID=A0A2U9C913_SCOMX|nr:Hypothetical protein SMAX5B_018689 [Scophthalmus maximus]
MAAYKEGLDGGEIAGGWGLGGKYNTGDDGEETWTGWDEDRDQDEGDRPCFTALEMNTHMMMEERERAREKKEAVTVSSGKRRSEMRGISPAVLLSLSHSSLLFHSV